MTEQPWSRALAHADERPDASPEEAARGAVTDLWFDLNTAVRHAKRAGWSWKCTVIANRIIRKSRAFGAPPWKMVPIPMVANDMFQAMMTDAGVEHTEPDEAELAEMQEIARQMAHAMTLRGRFANWRFGRKWKRIFRSPRAARRPES